MTALRYLHVPLSGLLACFAATALIPMAQAQTKLVTLAAAGKPAQHVCRVLPVGIAVHDRIRGEVTAVHADRVTVRIEDAGRHPHMIGDRTLVKGMSVESAAADWTACTE